MRQKISVCMASFNGGAYIKAQVDSILSQLGASDELIVIDDASTDNTVHILKDFNDPRISLRQNPSNYGAVRTFEKALQFADGDLIFLSDQDDIWDRNKVARICQVFEAHNDVTLVVSDALIIDHDGRVIAPSFFQIRGGFSPGVIATLLKNKYVGCMMAFRRQVAERFLPFPNNVPMHDMWIGLMNELYGKAYFIDEPLIAYRRHQNNATSLKHGSLRRMLRFRAALIKVLLVHFGRTLVKDTCIANSAGFVSLFSKRKDS